MERSFADAKQHHNHRYARFRGEAKVQMQCYLAASAQNIKKIALLINKSVKNKLMSRLTHSIEGLVTLILPVFTQRLSNRKNIAIAAYGC